MTKTPQQIRNEVEKEKKKDIINEYIKFRDKYEKRMLDKYSAVTLDDRTIIKLFFAQRGNLK